jgi:hypothetical protein
LSKHQELFWLSFVVGVHWLFIGGGGWILIRRIGGVSSVRLVVKTSDFALESKPVFVSQDDKSPENIAKISWLLHQRYGWLWRRKVYLLLVVGGPSEVNSIAPGLVDKHWLEARSVVLLYGGSVSTTPDTLYDVERGGGIRMLRELRLG